MTDVVSGPHRVALVTVLGPGEVCVSCFGCVVAHPHSSPRSHSHRDTWAVVVSIDIRDNFDVSTHYAAYAPATQVQFGVCVDI